MEKRKTAWAKLVEDLGIDEAKKEMARRSSLADKSKNVGYLGKLKQEGREDELKQVASKGGKAMHENYRRLMEGK